MLLTHYFGIVTLCTNWAYGSAPTSTSITLKKCMSVGQLGRRALRKIGSTQKSKLSKLKSDLYSRPFSSESVSKYLQVTFAERDLKRRCRRVVKEIYESPDNEIVISCEDEIKAMSECVKSKTVKDNEPLLKIFNKIIYNNSLKISKVQRNILKDYWNYEDARAKNEFYLRAFGIPDPATRKMCELSHLTRITLNKFDDYDGKLEKFCSVISEKLFSPIIFEAQPNETPKEIVGRYYCGDENELQFYEIGKCAEKHDDGVVYFKIVAALSLGIPGNNPNCNPYYYFMMAIDNHADKSTDIVNMFFMDDLFNTRGNFELLDEQIRNTFVENLSKMIADMETKRPRVQSKDRDEGGPSGTKSKSGENGKGKMKT